MTDTLAPAPTSVDAVSPPETTSSAVLDDAAKAAAAAAQPAPQFRLVPADLPSLLAVLADFAAPANQHLDAAFRVAIEAGKPKGDAIRDVPHFEALREWVVANPDLAARVVQVAVYLSSGRFVAQELAPPAEPVAATPTGQASPEAG